MRNKKGFSFDEEKDAEKIITNGFTNGIDYCDMYIIAKYFRETLGYGTIRLERELIRFCTTQDKNFNPIVEAAAIKKWINSAMKYSLRKIGSVSISEEEIKTLKSIENSKDRKLIYATLLLAKALKQRSTRRKKENLKTSEHYYIRYNKFLDIIKISKVKDVGEIKLADILGKYKHLFGFYSPEKELLRIEFVDKNPENPFIISDLENIMKYYDTFFPTKASNICIDCKKKIEKNSNRQVRCKECAKKARNYQQKNLMKTRRTSGNRNKTIPPSVSK